MTDKQVILSIVIMAAITIALRTLPFLLFKGKTTPKWIDYLGRVLSYSVMGMLVVYSQHHYRNRVIYGSGAVCFLKHQAAFTDKPL